MLTGVMYKVKYLSKVDANIKQIFKKGKVPVNTLKLFNNYALIS